MSVILYFITTHTELYKSYLIFQWLNYDIKTGKTKCVVHVAHDMSIL